MRDLVGGWWGLPQPTSEAHRSGFAISKLRFRLRLRLHGVAHNTPSPMAGLQRRLVAAADLRRRLVAVAGAYLWHEWAWGVWNIFCNFVSWNETNNFF